MYLFDSLAGVNTSVGKNKIPFNSYLQTCVFCYIIFYAFMIKCFHWCYNLEFYEMNSTVKLLARYYSFKNFVNNIIIFFFFNMIIFLGLKPIEKIAQCKIKLKILNAFIEFIWRTFYIHWTLCIYDSRIIINHLIIIYFSLKM